MSKYIFSPDSLSFLVTKGRVESKVTATCVFLGSDIKCLTKVELICKKSDQDTIDVTSIALEPKGYYNFDFKTYLIGHFGLSDPVALRKSLADIATSSVRNADCFALLTADLPDKWVEFAREMYCWIVEKVIPVVQKEIDIHQTFFPDVE